MGHIFDNFIGIKDRAYLWLAERCLAGEPQFKASDVKEKFLSTSSTIIEEVAKLIQNDGANHHKCK